MILCAVGIDDLGTVMEDLHKLECRWRRLGTVLGIQQHQLNTFCPMEDHKEKFIQVLCKWMDQKADEATLGSLYRALMAVQLSGLANKILSDQDLIGLLHPPG